MATFRDHKFWVWLDIETTGSRPEDHEVLEVGVVITDPDLKVLSERAWFIKADVKNVNTTVGKMHSVNELWNEYFSSPKKHTLTQVSDELVKELTRLGREAKERPLLCGSGVLHFDRRFIEHHCPRFFLNAGFAYYGLDVGVLRRAFDWNMDKRARAAHRAVDDCYNAIEQYRFFLTQVKGD